VPSENVTQSVGGDRRTRKREARREHLLDLAAGIVENEGVTGLTMTALADVADYAPASLYTYFDSRSALVASLQQRALGTLARVAREHRCAWDAALAGVSRPGVSNRRLHALARLWAFSDLFLAAPERQPHEFRLQQQLLVTPGVEDSADAATVLPAAMTVLDVPRELLAEAVSEGALLQHGERRDPLGEPIDGDVLRTFAWVVALNGALMVDSLSMGLPSTGAALGAEITASLLSGWGADARLLTAARGVADELADLPPAGSQR
jgi:AcrR family transcriptional regulator